jgi:HD-GYP domain-containing protein (c-di-GMP phosphodiesterase class II)/chaperonin cofactor prefoldin
MSEFDVVKYFVQQVEWIASALDAIIEGRPLPPVSNQPGGKVGKIMDAVQALAAQSESLKGRREQGLSLDQEFAEVFKGLGTEQAAKDPSPDVSELKSSLTQAERRIEELLLANQALKDHARYLTGQLHSNKEALNAKSQLEQRLSLRETEANQLQSKTESLETALQELKARFESMADQGDAETRVFKSLSKIREIISVALQPEELLRRVCSIPSSFIDCHRCATYLHDTATSSFVPVGFSGLNHTLIPLFKGTKISEGDIPLVQMIVSRKRPAFVEDCRKAPRTAKLLAEDGSFELIKGNLPFVPKEYAERFGTQSLLAVPIVSRGKTAGILLVDFGSLIHAFSESEVAALEGLAQLIGAALDNIRVFHDSSTRLLDLERQTGTESVLREMKEVVSSTNEAEQIIRSVIGFVPRIIPSEWTSVLLLDRLARGYYVIGNLGELIRGKGSIPFDHTTFTDVLRPDQVLHRPNLRSEPHLSELDHHLLSHGVGSDLLFPISVGASIAGILHITSRRVAGFSHEDLVIGQNISMQLAGALGRATAQRVKDRRKGNGYFETIQALLDRASARDFKLGDYRDQMIECGLSLAKRFEFSEEEQEWIKYAILLHDIGKSTIPEHILNKRDGLSDREIAILRTHPVQGSEMIKNFRFTEIIKGMKFVRSVVPLVRHSYERWDGSGYPDGLAGDQIPQGARILSVVNASAAMMMDRPYRKALRPEEAIREIREGAGSQFDPRVVEHFFGYFQEQRN